MKVYTKNFNGAFLFNELRWIVCEIKESIVQRKKSS